MRKIIRLECYRNLLQRINQLQTWVAINSWIDEIVKIRVIQKIRVPWSPMIADDFMASMITIVLFKMIITWSRSATLSWTEKARYAICWYFHHAQLHMLSYSWKIKSTIACENDMRFYRLFIKILHRKQRSIQRYYQFFLKILFYFLNQQ